MNGFHQSRGRILFDAFCAFGMSASCAWAWVQTYATALLGAAAIAGLYGLVRFFDVFSRVAVVEAEVAVDEPVPQEVAPEPLELRSAPQELPAEVVAALVRKPRKKAAKKPAKAERAVEQATSEPEPEAHHSAPIAPLFEPEPFVRLQQRAAFGRKLGAR